MLACSFSSSHRTFLFAHHSAQSLQHLFSVSRSHQAQFAGSATAAARPALFRYAGTGKHPRLSHVTYATSGLLDEIEHLKREADALDSELQEASRTAEVAAKRSRRMAARCQELQAYALEHVMLGDEEAARAALLQKAAVVEALSQASKRAEANSALARKLEDVLASKQLLLMGLIRQAKAQAAAATAAGLETEQCGPARGTAVGVRGLKRSRSVAWSSPSMHASSDGWEERQQQGNGQQEQPCELAAELGEGL